MYKEAMEFPWQSFTNLTMKRQFKKITDIGTNALEDMTQLKEVCFLSQWSKNAQLNHYYVVFDLTNNSQTKLINIRKVLCFLGNPLTRTPCRDFFPNF